MQKRRTPIECLEFMRNIAQQNGAELLDTDWNKADTYYSFKLANGEIIKRKYIQISYSGWHKSENAQIKINARSKLPEQLIQELQLIAENNKGKLLETEWKGGKHKYCFENEFGDKFYRTSSAIKSYGWPKNWKTYLLSNSEKKGMPKNKYSIKDLNNIAQKNLGKCLETQYLGFNKPHLFEDEFGNQFYSSPKRIFQGYWNINRGLVSEPICRQVLEHLFNYKFPTSRSILTAKLLNIKRNLELDGYCKEIKIAFEYQGYPSHWDTKHKNYQTTHTRDLLKKDWCDKLGIVLLQIPVFEKSHFHWNSKTVFTHILNLVTDTFKSLNKPLPALNTSNFSIQFDKINHNRQQLQNLKDIALKHGGKLISTVWKCSKDSYLFEDKDSNRFKMTVKNYLVNGWPQNVNKYNKHQIGHKKTNKDLLKELKDLAKTNNCQLLDKKWNGDNFKYSFLTKEKTIIQKTASSMKKYGLKTKNSTLQDKENKFLFLLKIAQDNNATLIEKEWISQRHFYSFVIAGKTYQFNYRLLKNNGWPKDLNKFTKNSIASKKTSDDFYQEMVDFAKKYNGKILTPNWLGNHTLHEFITEEGIIFEKKPVNIKRSGWYQ